MKALIINAGLGFICTTTELNTRGINGDLASEIIRFAADGATTEAIGKEVKGIGPKHISKLNSLVKRFGKPLTEDTETETFDCCPEETDSNIENNNTNMEKEKTMERKKLNIGQQKASRILGFFGVEPKILNPEIFLGSKIERKSFVEFTVTVGFTEWEKLSAGDKSAVSSCFRTLAKNASEKGWQVKGKGKYISLRKNK